METRLERDALGPVDVPEDALWGAQTERARSSFDIGGRTLAELPELVTAYAQVKAAAARANAGFGTVAPDVAAAIEAAALAVAAGGHADAFPLPVLQGGGGTSTNMNLNEVVANLAEERLGGRRGMYERVHPLDHVNRSQSTNDTYPTALALATVVVGRECLSGLAYLGEALRAAARDGDGLDRLGRTCLQDAVPLSAVAGLEATAHALARTAAELARALDGLLTVPLGATAIGTGIGAPPGFGEAAVAELARVSGLEVTVTTDRYDGLRHADGLLAVADALGRVWLVVSQLARDLRLLSSGPSGGIGELLLPALQPGSSIMPGKVNPVVPELVLQVGYELRGMAVAVGAAAGAGELELNVMEPAIAAALLPGLERAGRTAHLFADRCIAGLRWNEERVAANLRGSLAEAVERATVQGHDAHG